MLEEALCCLFQGCSPSDLRTCELGEKGLGSLKSNGVQLEHLLDLAVSVLSVGSGSVTCARYEYNVFTPHRFCRQRSLSSHSNSDIPAMWC